MLREVVLFFSIFVGIVPALDAAIPPPAVVTCNISCTVANVVEWSETQTDYDLEDITEKKQDSDDPSFTLYLNGDVTLIANDKNAVELSFDRHTAQTSYNFKYDGLQLKQTTRRQNTAKLFVTQSDEIKTPANSYFEVTLSVAENIIDNDCDNSNTTNIFTVCWKS